jgi:hypothetical protein
VRRRGGSVGRWRLDLLLALHDLIDGDRGDGDD